MTGSRFVGSSGIRVATMASASACGIATALYLRADAAGGSGLLVLAIGTGVLAFVGLIISVRKAHAIWMGFAEALNAAVVTLLFGSCYLVVVPVFRVLLVVSGALRSRRHTAADTFWIPKRDAKVDLDSLQRMG